jgi:integrase/recombinase XerC/integrase/recombinase XerD
MATTETDTNTRATAWLKPGQVRELRTAAQSDAFQPYLRDRNEALVAMLYDTGLRVGELVQLKTDYLHLEDDQPYLAIPAAIQKDYPTDRSPQYEEMNLAVDASTYDTVSRLRSFLTNRWKDSAYLFPSRQADRMTTESVRRAVQSLAEEADVRPQTLTGDRGGPEDVTPHTLRHSVAYRLLHEEDGYTLYDVRNRLRHASIQTTERNYDHFDRI